MSVRVVGELDSYDFAPSLYIGVRLLTLDRYPHTGFVLFSRLYVFKGSSPHYILQELLGSTVPGSSALRTVALKTRSSGMCVSAADPLFGLVFSSAPIVGVKLCAIFVQLQRLSVAVASFRTLDASCPCV